MRHLIAALLLVGGAASAFADPPKPAPAWKPPETVTITLPTPQAGQLLEILRSSTAPFNTTLPLVAAVMAQISKQTQPPAPPPSAASVPTQKK